LGDAGADGKWAVYGGDPHFSADGAGQCDDSHYFGAQGHHPRNKVLSREAALAAKGEAMKSEYDFSKGQRGKFYKADAVLKLPVYLDDDVQSYLTTKAESKGVELSDLVNDLLKKEIAIIETAK
jgi:hypothetical protein